MNKIFSPRTIFITVCWFLMAIIFTDKFTINTLDEFIILYTFVLGAGYFGKYWLTLLESKDE